jgi:hypothetical protein
MQKQENKTRKMQKQRFMQPQDARAESWLLSSSHLCESPSIVMQIHEWKRKRKDSRAMTERQRWRGKTYRFELRLGTVMRDTFKVMQAGRHPDADPISTRQ